MFALNSGAYGTMPILNPMTILPSIIQQDELLEYTISCLKGDNEMQLGKGQIALRNSQISAILTCL